MIMPIVFMGTPDFAIHSLVALTKENYMVKAVVTRPDKVKGRGKVLSAPPVKEWALKNGIKVLQPHRLDAHFLKELKLADPALIVTVAYGRILPREILSLPRLGCINLHASLLPSYRGAAPVHRAVINGEKETGVTIIYMTEKMDAGDIILQERVPIMAKDTAGSLHESLASLGAELLLKAVDLIKNGKANPAPQDEDKVSYAPPLTREDEEIDWCSSSAHIYNLIRGMNPWPGAYTYCGHKRLKIWVARLLPIEESGNLQGAAPGEVLSVGECGIRVGTASGVLLITKVQPAGRRQMSASDYARGYFLQKGDRLGKTV